MYCESLMKRPVSKAIINGRYPINQKDFHNYMRGTAIGCLNSWQCVGPREYPKAQRGGVRLNRLRREPYVILNRDEASFEAFCHIIGIHLGKNQVVRLTISSIRGALLQYQEYDFRFLIQIFRQKDRVRILVRREVQ
jgi:hypothetical protein